MEKEEIILEHPVEASGVTLIPVVCLTSCHRRSGVLTFASKRPVAVIAVSGSGVKALRTSGEEATLDELAKEWPGIGEKLDNMLNRRSNRMWGR